MHHLFVDVDIYFFMSKILLKIDKSLINLLEYAFQIRGTIELIDQANISVHNRALGIISRDL